MTAAQSAAAALLFTLLATGCNTTEPEPATGHIEGRVSVCAAGTELCFTAERNIRIEATGPVTKTTTLTSETFRFHDLEAGSYTLAAQYTGSDDGCVFNFQPTRVTVVADETADATIHGRGAC